ncbi:MAG: response regulator transcription factor [Actinobacteria bacterium]|nr:response regulator transcription factor [Actinomycetota bacterium]
MPVREGTNEAAVVLIEDDPSISELLQLYLAREGYQVHSAALGAQGIDLVRERAPALVILDLMLPDRSGFDILKSIRSFSAVPLIILTARDAEQDKILGLELGADDYMVKPFSPGELVARARAVLRRAGALEDSSPSVQRAGDIELLPEERTARVAGVPLDLTRKEFELLHYLLVNRGLALSRERLLEEVWGYRYYGEARTVDVHVGQLRKKLGRWGGIIQTVWGFGYKVDPSYSPSGDSEHEETAEI